MAQYKGIELWNYYEYISLQNVTTCFGYQNLQGEDNWRGIRPMKSEKREDGNKR
jgi:hypothetical protein